MTNPDEFDARLTPEQWKRLEKRFREIYGSDSETDLTPEERLSFQKEFENLHDSFQKIGHGLHAAIRDKVSELAGMHMTVMLHSPEEAEQYLESCEGSLRLAALYVLYHHWGQKDTYANRYERIAMCDSNAEVRIVSLAFFGSCFKYTGDTRVSRMLASVVLDANEPGNIRLAAYGSLLRVHGYPTEVGRAFALKFPDDVNWDFVQRWCGSTPPGRNLP